MGRLEEEQFHGVQVGLDAAMLQEALSVPITLVMLPKVVYKAAMKFYYKKYHPNEMPFMMTGILAPNNGNGLAVVETYHRALDGHFTPDSAHNSLQYINNAVASSPRQNLLVFGHVQPFMA